MPLRPIDAIFVHPERRLYVVYYRGVLWQLPRMKIDDAAWQRRQPYKGNSNALYLSRQQTIHDPILAQNLRTLNLPDSVRGSTLPRFEFEAWWEMHGYDWLKDKITTGQSPLAAHQSVEPPPVSSPDSDNNSDKNNVNDYVNDSASILPSNVIDNTENSAENTEPTTPPTAMAEATVTDVFADMLADLANEVMLPRSEPNHASK